MEVEVIEHNMNFNIFGNKQSKTKDPIDAIIQVESKGKTNAVGDKHLENKAYGPLQIRKPVLDDVNKYYGTDYNLADAFDSTKSKQIFKKYTDIYATSTRIGRTPTFEDKARIWNGGPNGFRNEKTKEYWNKVKNNL